MVYCYLHGCIHGHKRERAPPPNGVTTNLKSKTKKTSPPPGNQPRVLWNVSTNENVCFLF